MPHAPEADQDGRAAAGKNAGGHPVGSPAKGSSTFQPTVRLTTSPTAVPSQTKEGERLTTPPASRQTVPKQAVPKQTPRRRTSAPTAKQTHTESLANTPTGDESRKGSTPDPTSGTTPEPAPETTTAAPPTFAPPPPYWTPPENPFTCAPSTC
ncbi:hypothetical protein GCM10010404_70940 [Nonomuraea africana]